TENTKILCMSLNDNILVAKNSTYSCVLNGGTYITKCEYKINEDNTGEIICAKSRALSELQTLID
ncbi:MAG: hypothetical protein IKV10_01895, partial [Alphaproteobacteria bacterium]|nr:hypothetical protein [Alphaproteobacteria bacterium]